MIKNIVFDYGGVLIDWNPLHLYNRWFDGNCAKAKWFIDNICTSAWNTQMDGGKPFAEGIAELTAEHPEWADAIAAYRGRWKEMIGGPIAGMHEVVKRLKAAGYHTFGLSNWSWETFSTICDDIPVLKELEGMIISGREYLLKPDAAIYRLLLERYGLAADECLFIDDNPDNVLGAQAVGMHSIRFIDVPTLQTQLKDLHLLND